MVSPRAPSFSAVTSFGIPCSFVPWNQQRPLFGNPRPRRYFDDRANCSRAGSRAHLFQAFAEMGAKLEPLRLDELQLSPDRLGKRHELEAQPRCRCGQLSQLRAECDAEPIAVRRRATQRDRSPPRSPAYQLRRQRELAHRSVAALGPSEKPVEQGAQRPPKRQLVRDRLRKLARLRKVVRRLSRADLATLLSSRQAPGPPAVRPQSFGHGGAR